MLAEIRTFLLHHHMFYSQEQNLQVWTCNFPAMCTAKCKSTIFVNYIFISKSLRPCRWSSSAPRWRPLGRRGGGRTSWLCGGDRSCCQAVTLGLCGADGSGMCCQLVLSSCKDTERHFYALWNLIMWKYGSLLFSGFLIRITFELIKPVIDSLLKKLIFS